MAIMEAENMAGQNPAALQSNTIPLGALDCRLTDETLCKAEQYKLQKSRAAGYAIVHEGLSDAAAGFGALSAGFTLLASGNNAMTPEDFDSLYKNLSSLALVAPIIVALTWERYVISSEYKAIKKMREIFRRCNNDPRILSTAGLVLEGLPKSVFEMDEESKKTAHSHIAAHGGEAFVQKLKKVSINLSRASNGNTLLLPAPEQDKPESVLSFCAHTALDVGHLFYKDKTPFKGMCGVLKSAGMAFWTLGRQGGEAASRYIYNPVRHGLDRLNFHSATYIEENYIFRPAARIAGFFKKEQAIAHKVEEKPDCPQPLSETQRNRTIDRVEADIKSAVRQSFLTGPSICLQSAFIVNEVSHGILLMANSIKNGNAADAPKAMAHFLAATLALRPLQVLSNRHVELYRAVHSDRAVIAHQMAESRKAEDQPAPAA